MKPNDELFCLNLHGKIRESQRLENIRWIIIFEEKCLTDFLDESFTMFSNHSTWISINLIIYHWDDWTNIDDEKYRRNLIVQYQLNICKSIELFNINHRFWCWNFFFSVIYWSKNQLNENKHEEEENRYWNILLLFVQTNFCSIP